MRVDFVQNIVMRFCFLVTIAGLPLLSAASLPQAPAKTNVATVTRTDSKTGRVVRSVVIAPRSANASNPVATATAKKKQAPAAIDELVNRASAEHGVDPLLVDAIIQIESNYNPFAISPKGAEGLMQLMPPTGRQWGARNAFDPEENIRAGVRYFKHLQDMFKDDRLAIAAYNAGENAVQKYGWIPPYPETVEYVYKVGRKYGENRRAAAASEVKVAELKQPAVDAISDNSEIEKTEALPRYRPVEYYLDADGKLFLKTR